jgi:hypothetical protein
MREKFRKSINMAKPQKADKSQRGSATLTSVLIMALMAMFCAAALSRVTSEALITGNDYAHTQAFYAAQASLEQMSRDFNNIFNVQIKPTTADLTRIKNNKPGISSFQFVQDIVQDAASSPKPIDDGPFSGLISTRTPWHIQSVATYDSGAQVQLTRTFYNHQIPLFQFGIFYNDDMEIHPGPNFNFGGRVHSNRHLFMAAGNTLTFRSRVTAAGEIVRDTSKMGARQGNSSSGWQWDGTVQVADAAGVNQPVTVGSVRQASGVQASNPDLPNWTNNSTWSTDSALFNGNLLARQQVLKLPLQIGTNNDPIELIRRGKSTDDDVLRDSRYYNKPGIRVCLSDSQSRLPGGAGGIRLDGAGDGLGGNSGSRAATTDGTRGYQPVAMGAYQAKRFNGNRMYTGASYTTGGMPANRQTWIKIEVITLDPDTYAPIATDRTADFLSLGMTDVTTVLRDSSNNPLGDSRAIFKMQRYEIRGAPLKVAPAEINTTNTTATVTYIPDARSSFGNRPAYTYNATAGTGVVGLNFVATSFLDTAGSWNRTSSGALPNATNGTATTNAAMASTEGTGLNIPDSTSGKTAGLPSVASAAFEVNANFTGTAYTAGATYRVVPFPIEIYSAREGTYNADVPNGSATAVGTSSTPSWWYWYTGAGSAPNPSSGSTTPGTATSTNSKVPVVGVISLIDIDMQNLGKFIRGDWDGQFPGGLASAQVPDNGGAGTIVYVSDRRGDADNDGVYKMEDIYGVFYNGTTATGSPNDGVLQPGEDFNRNNVLDTDFVWEADRYPVGIETDVAAVLDHKYFRRGVRVINGETLIGTINKGYTISTENGLYTLGNYNATGLTAAPASGTQSQPSEYTGSQVPASLVADAVTILSEEWTDSKSFRSPDDIGTRSVTTAGETTVRAALLMGDTLSSLRGELAVPAAATRPNQGSADRNLSGGVHNFPRFLESWGTRVNYCGSLINLFNSNQHNGAHKTGSIYGAPVRNWVFDTSFLDPTRMPPGTPFFQYIQMTGFRQTVRQLS